MLVFLFNIISNVNFNVDNYLVLVGDFQVEEYNNVSLILKNNLVWIGVVYNVKSVDVDSSSVWNLIGDVDVELMYILGQMNFILSSSNLNVCVLGYSFSILIINSNFIGNGSFVFNV